MRKRRLYVGVAHWRFAHEPALEVGTHRRHVVERVGACKRTVVALSMLPRSPDDDARRMRLVRVQRKAFEIHDDGRLRRRGGSDQADITQAKSARQMTEAIVDEEPADVI